MAKILKLKVGTRGSQLALKQVDIVLSELTKHIDCEFEIIKFQTTGDTIHDKPLYNVGGKALFLKELEEALLRQDIDFAVHSLKDAPGLLDERMKIICTLEREATNDCLITTDTTIKSIAHLPHGITVGTSSPRRIVQLNRARPDLEIFHMRGNVLTRIQKMLDSQCDVLILACAGLLRLGIMNNYGGNNVHYNILDIDEMLPAVGQGAVCIEALRHRADLVDVFSMINHIPTFVTTALERCFLRASMSDCKTPAACNIRTSTVINNVHIDDIFPALDYAGYSYNSEMLESIKTFVTNNNSFDVKCLLGPDIGMPYKTFRTTLNVQNIKEELQKIAHNLQ